MNKRIEHVRMSKPYPPFKIVVDGPDLVVSVGPLYWRFHDLFPDVRHA